MLAAARFGTAALAGRAAGAAQHQHRHQQRGVADSASELDAVVASALREADRGVERGSDSAQFCAGSELEAAGMSSKVKTFVFFFFCVLLLEAFISFFLLLLVCNFF